MRLKIFCILIFLSCLATQPTYIFSQELIDNTLADPLLPSFGRARPLTSFLYNPWVSPDLWQELEPYFLPHDHPIKARLDTLFNKIRATQSESHFEKAGFGKPKMRKPTNIVIGRHEQFKNYLFKVYLDTQPPLSEWVNWVHRIKGARAIQMCLERHGFQNFCVPNKWIYPLPPEPSPPNQNRFHRKNFILIVENMNILSPKANLKAFKNKVTSQILQELYVILTEEGLIDSVYPDNIPFTKNGQIAFIDTEHHYFGRSIPYEKLTPYLSKEMQEFWQNLTIRND